MRAVTIHAPYLAIALLGSGCTVAADDGNPFGTAPPMTSAPPLEGSGDASTGGSAGSSGGGGDASSSGGAPTTGVADGSTGPGLTTGVSVGSTTDGGGGNGTQPLDGMYSECAVPADCGFAPTLCITINDAGGATIGGFCSETGCNNPAVDCDPSPNGAVTPVCVPVTVNMMADMACALQCSGGAACPPPMQCINVTGFGEVCV